MNVSMRMHAEHQRYTRPAHGRRIRWLATIMLMVCSCIVKPALAGNCAYTPTSPTFMTVASNLSGSITVGRDVPVGTEIYRATFNVSNNMLLNCDAGTYQVQFRYASNPYPLASYVDPKFGANVYTTPIPGIGVVVWYAGNALPYNTGMATYPNPLLLTLGSGLLSFDVSLIKISNTVGAGTIRGSDLPTLKVLETNLNGGNSLLLENGSFIGQVSVVARTCTTPDVTVDLGTHYTHELTGVGSTTAQWVNVPIALNNCPAFFGYGHTQTNQSNGSVVPGLLASNAIQYNIAPVTSVVVPAQGVMALQPDGVNPTATGIGIQIANASAAPVTYNVNTNSGLNLSQTEGANYVIPLQARYYQTAANPTAGQANGAATVTLIYN